ncbi:RsmB/NOP family class I SAM-dependent RNA methyltransferase [Prosthecomicrobium pneumaticum]|uniref:16S rRNA (Cytosine967-C5)-methyltransferase n=1 Tax=Prosthecomicrobium pneumaticum TaxID=81895 RepID=A0A7W9FR25_9HYPH|nr:RsmB/NOP family class I SAM-dependent RNA methyltransferase [Prosthecomicrobium pneumaticum]MBB5755238.1 16S rRNA (cytosine967-C5)-methyltransferase [Prosthecomicrobium pneumaticum]
MTPAARIAAAIEVFDDIEARRRPAADALKDWGLAHRFAGSKDRRAIGDLVYDALRRKRSAAHAAGGEGGRATLAGLIAVHHGLGLAGVEALFSGERFAPAPLEAEIRAALGEDRLAAAPAAVRGDYPDWLEADLAAVFGDGTAAEMAAFAQAAPLDLRANTLKGEADAIAARLAEELGRAPERPELAAAALRYGAERGTPEPHVVSTESYLKGLVEIQDLGSQLAAVLAGARPGEQVLDLCAGGGGKTLALAAAMDNRGQIYAHDSDRRRLAPIHDRLARAGVRNVQIRTPRPGADVLADLEGAMDLVLVDAPCTGTGTWRRNPDAKWRLRPGSLAERLKEQAAILDGAVRFLKPGGRLVYVTCSVLEAENGAQLRRLAAARPELALDDGAALLAGDGAPPADRVLPRPEGLLMTPRRTGTDGFFVGRLTRR